MGYDSIVWQKMGGKLPKVTILEWDFWLKTGVYD